MLMMLKSKLCWNVIMMLKPKSLVRDVKGVREGFVRDVNDVKRKGVHV
jgi:hypothetical protein